jgi:hypothetical protein
VPPLMAFGDLCDFQMTEIQLSLAGTVLTSARPHSLWTPGPQITYNGLFLPLLGVPDTWGSVGTGLSALTSVSEQAKQRHSLLGGSRACGRSLGAPGMGGSRPPPPPPPPPDKGFFRAEALSLLCRNPASSSFLGASQPREPWRVRAGAGLLPAVRPRSLGTTGLAFLCCYLTGSDLQIKNKMGV